MNLSDQATAHKGVWTPTDQTATVEQWLTIGNLKAGAAAEAAAEAAAGVKSLASKGLPVTLSDAQLDQLAAKVVPLLPKPPSAADIATELAKRLQS